MEKFSSLQEFYDNTICDTKVYASFLVNKKIEFIKLIFSEEKDASLVPISTQKKQYTFADINRIVSYFNIECIKYQNAVCKIQDMKLIADFKTTGFNNFSMRQKLFVAKRTLLADALSSFKKEPVLVPAFFEDNQIILKDKEYIINGKTLRLVPVYSDSYESSASKEKSELLLLSMDEISERFKKDVDGIYINPDAKDIPGIKGKKLNMLFTKHVINQFW